MRILKHRAMVLFRGYLQFVYIFVHLAVVIPGTSKSLAHGAPIQMLTIGKGAPSTQDVRKLYSLHSLHLLSVVSDGHLLYVSPYSCAVDSHS